MTADTLQRLREAGAIDARELADLLNLSTSAAYDRFGKTPLTFDQFRTLFRRAADDRVREMFLADLLAGTGFLSQRIDPNLDLNGDGIVDFADATASGLKQIASAAQASIQLDAASRNPDTATAPVLDKLLDQIDDLIGQTVITRSLVAHHRDLAKERKQARPRVLGLSKGGAL